jgi:Response regulator containing a CheY-like receiver domain and an HTH DNA-binding domain
MANNHNNNLKIIRTSTDQRLNVAETLCQFSFDEHELLAVKLDDGNEEIDTLIADEGYSVTEVCRFTVNNCDCAIVKKIPLEVADDLNLRVVLSARELQIATLIAMGCPNKQVADKLHISEWTVATYLRRVFAKLGVDTRAAMTFRCASLIEKQDTILNKPV